MEKVPLQPHLIWGAVNRECTHLWALGKPLTCGGTCKKTMLPLCSIILKTSSSPDWMLKHVPRLAALGTKSECLCCFLPDIFFYFGACGELLDPLGAWRSWISLEYKNAMARREVWACLWTRNLHIVPAPFLFTVRSVNSYVQLAYPTVGKTHTFPLQKLTWEAQTGARHEWFLSCHWRSILTLPPFRVWLLPHY